jgi:hypothetical protein
VLDLEVEIESLTWQMSTSIKQYHIVDMGSPQKPRSAKILGSLHLNAMTAQDPGPRVASMPVEVDEENFLVIETRATPKWWWLVHPALPEPWPGLWKASADFPPGWGGSQEKWKSPDGQSGLPLVSLSISIGQRAVVARFGLPAAGSHLAGSNAGWPRPELLALVLGELFGCEFARLDVAFVQFHILLPFLRRSSSAKIADTGQTGTHAPLSMHSTGSM